MPPALLMSTFLSVMIFLKIKDGGPKFWGEPILPNVWIILSPLLYCNLRSSMDQNSSPFITFQCVPHDWAVLFSQFWYFYKLRTAHLISAGNQFRKMSQLFGPPFCISIGKVLETQILRHSLHFNVFCMIQE